MTREEAMNEIRKDLLDLAGKTKEESDKLKAHLEHKKKEHDEAVVKIRHLIGEKNFSNWQAEMAKAIDQYEKLTVQAKKQIFKELIKEILDAKKEQEEQG